MEAQGTGGYNLDHRVSSLERSVTGLHEDSRKTQAAVAGLGVQVSDMMSAVRDIADKLDSHRMRRPDLQSAATTIIALVAIGGLAFAPLYRTQERLLTTVSMIDNTQDERSYIIGEYEARIKALESQLLRAEDEVDEVQKNRFTKEDGQALLDRIFELHAGD